MTKQVFSLQQRTFPFNKKSFEINPQTRKLRIVTRSPLTFDEVQIDLEGIDENYQKVKKFSLTRLLLALLATGYTLALICLWFVMTPAFTQETIFYLFLQGLLVVVTAYAWRIFFLKSYNLTSFFSRFTRQLAFSLHNDNPNKEEFEDFCLTLKNIVSNSEHSRDLQYLLNNIPTHILVEEFSSSYLDELIKRGIDVGTLLCFLQKRILNSQHTIQ